MSVSALEPLPSLSPRQADVLLFIGQYFALHREAPSHNEIRVHLGLGDRTNVGPYLRPLFHRQYLEQAGTGVRGRMKLTPLGLERLQVLLQGKAGGYQELRELIHTVQSAV